MECTPVKLFGVRLQWDRNMPHSINCIWHCQHHSDPSLNLSEKLTYFMAMGNCLFNYIVYSYIASFI